MLGRPHLLLALLVAISGLPAFALETDQFYGWTRPLADSTDLLNAKANLEIARALDSVNNGRARDRISCQGVTRRISARFRFFRKSRAMSLPRSRRRGRTRRPAHGCSPLCAAPWLGPNGTPRYLRKNSEL